MAYLATRQPFFGGVDDAPTAASTEYASIFGGNSSNTWATSESWRQSQFPIAGVMRKFKVRIDTAPGSGKSVTFTIMKNGSASAMAVTISDTNTEGEYTAADLSIAAGDRVSIRCTQTNTPTLFTRSSWSFMFEPTTAKRCVIIGGTGNGTGDALATEYQPASGGFTWSATNTQRQSLVAIDGTIRSWRIRFMNAAPRAGTTMTFYIYKNGAQEASSAITFTSASATAQSLSGLSIDIAPGDLLSIGCVTTGTADTTARFQNWGIEIEPDNDGESQFCGGRNGPGNAATSYNYPTNQSGIAGVATESKRTVEAGVAERFTISDFRGEVSTAPGAGKSWALTVRKNSGAGNSTFTIADTATNNVDSTHTDVFEYGDDMSIKLVPSGTPTTTGIRMVWAAKVTMDWQEIPVTKSLQYAVKRPVAITKSLKYTVHTEHAAITKSLKYVVLTTPAAQTKSLRYAVVAPEGISKSLEYMVRSVVGAELPLEYQVRTEGAIQKDLGYAVVADVAIMKDLAYEVLSEAGIQKVLEYVVQVQESVEKSLLYKVLSTEDVQKGLAYYILTEGLGIEKGLDYIVVSQESIQKSLGYSVLSEQGKALTLAYAVAITEAINKTLGYEVLTATAIQKELEYMIRTEGAVQVPLTYEIKQAELIQKDLEYQVTAEAGIGKVLDYAVLTSPSMQKSLEYQVLVAEGIQKELVYRVTSSPDALTKTLEYQVVYTAEAVEKGLVYAILTASAIEKGMSYEVLTESGILKDFEYKVRSMVETGKDLAYAIVRPVKTEKGMAYSMILGDTFEKEMAYYVTVDHDVEKGLSYVVRPYPYRRKGSPYTKKPEGPYSKKEGAIFIRKATPYEKRNTPYKSLRKVL